MRKRIYLQLSLLFFLSIYSYSQSPGSSDDRNTLIIMNPTVNHLSGVLSLINDGVFPVKDHKIKAVYFADETYDYSETEQYINVNKLDISLEKIDCDLFADKLFCINACSPVFEKLFNESSGIFFYGGPDIPPAIYGEKTSTLTVITDPYRHYFEASFLFHLLGGYQDMNFPALLDKKPDYLVVGFCLGMQTMNVATGGSLIQDIPQEVYNLQNVEDILRQSPDQQHRNYESNLNDFAELFWGNIHPVRPEADGWFIKEHLVGANQFPAVVSSHHQAVERPGKNIKVEARSMDGKVIESISNSRFPNVFGFQFHPEVTDIYSHENSWQFHHSGGSESLKSEIEKGDGFEFHVALWRKFAAILNSN